MEKRKICIIGGGASGLMAAVMAAREGAEVTLLEHNEKIGRKILATGNGRCNLTNIYQEPSCYHSLSGTLAWEILQGFSLQDTIRFFFSDRRLYEKQRGLSLSRQHAGFQRPGIAGDGGQIPESQDQMQGTCKRDPQRRTRLSGIHRNLELSGG